MESAEPYLAKVFIFEDLSGSELAKIAQLFTFTKFSPGQPVFNCGDSGNNFFIIKSGLVKVYNVNSNGKVIILAMLGPNDFFGEMALFDDSPRSAGVDAIEATEAFVLTKTHFQHLLRENPEISWKMLSVLSKRLRETNEQLERLTYLSVEERLTKSLLELATRCGRKQNQRWSIPLNLTHQELGQLIGTSRESVTRCLCRLQQEGKIDYSESQITLNF
jgi:CRP/FNR family transcriptional regulator, cyclic AMP receptor protein